MELSVSIIIPVFNQVGLLKYSIDSAIHQTWRNKEVIVIDDGSVDGSYELAVELSKQLPLRVFRQEHKGGCSARNLGLKYSTGNFIQFLDSDDVLDPNKISHQIFLLRSIGDNSAVASCDFDKFSGSRILKKHTTQRNYSDGSFYFLEPKELLLDFWQGKKMGQTAIWLTPRDLIERVGLWDESLLCNQDGEFFNRILLSASRVVHVGQILVHYRIGNSQSVSQNISVEAEQSRLRSYELITKVALNKYSDFVVRYSLAHLFQNFLYLNVGRFESLNDHAHKLLEELELRKLPNVGGWKFRILLAFIDFHSALSIRRSWVNFLKWVFRSKNLFFFRCFNKRFF